MPTSVSIVRQCLAIEAVHALDEAVRVARRRGHAQTTSLHLVSSLLSLPSSPLREACSRIRNDAFTMRIQFKALELCLSVSLDRLPSALSGVGEQEQEQELEPPVSNSLMAAVKRSQANQRRQPENFSFYQQHMLSSSSSSSAVTVVKVELRNLILSILDDPVVSRVFGDAGFRSCEIKMAILRQVHQLFRYSRNKWPRGPPPPPPPLFLCNLNGDNNHLRRKGFSFPFIGFSEFPDSEENCRRIAEVMEKNDGNGRRNPLLVGACAFDSLKSFLGMIQGRRERSEMPMKLSGLSVISLEDDILRFVTGKYEECLMKLKFEEVGKIVGNSVAPGVVINFGDLKALVCDHASIDTLRFIVSELTKLLEIHGSKVWLIGAAATYEAYLKFSQMFPSAEMDLDLQLLPITATRISMAKSYPKSSSFRRQFRCHLCEEKCQQEVNTLSDARVDDSIAASIPPLPHVAERNTDGGFHEALASKDRDIFTVKISGLHKKWDNICQHLHYGQQFPKPSDFRFSPGAENVNQESDSSFQENSPLSNKRFKTISMDAAASGSSSPTSLLPNTDLNKIHHIASSIDSLESNDGNGLKSPEAVASASTDLNLELNTASIKSSRSNFCSNERLDQRDFKLLYASLAKRIGWQQEAVKVISESIVHCRTTTEKQSKSNRGNIWFSFLGPDQLGKRKLAIALAEILYGNQENLIHLDLSRSNSMLNLEDWDSHHVICRGKNVVDYVADELRKKPTSVVLLENIEKADVLLQQSLSHALKNGRFLDSDGREISISNTIFITTSAAAMDGTRKLHSKTAIYSEEDVSSVKSCTIHITIGIDLREMVECGSSSRILMNKRKHEGKTETVKQIGHRLELTKRVHKSSDTNLDLNIPPEDVETADQDSTFENNAKWVRDFLGQVHAKVVFQPFDFDALANNILKDITEQFQKTVGSESCLEIDYRVMMQMISAGYVDSYKSVEGWVETVLKSSFEEAQEKYSLTCCSIVKLVAGEGTIAREQFLPSKIIVH